MTTVTLTTSDPRYRAPFSWLPIRASGSARIASSPAHAPSAFPRRPNAVSATGPTGVTCCCYDVRQRQLACRHVIAKRIDSISRCAEPQPASAVVDGLRTMVEANSRRNDDMSTRFRED